MPVRQNQQPFLLELIKSLIPITPMGKAMLIGIVVWFVDWGFATQNALFGSRILKTFFDVASVLAVIPLVYFAFKAAGWVTQHLLWRLRRRLIVTYLLIGALPLLLFGVLVALVGWVVVMQSSASLVDRQLDGYLEQSLAASEAISRDLSDVDEEGWQPERMRRRLQERADALGPIFPNVTLSVRQNGGINLSVRGASREAQSLPDNFNNTELQPTPSWLKSLSDFHGLVVEEKLTGERMVYARHIHRLNNPPGTIFQLSYPISIGLCNHLSHTTDLEVIPGKALTPLMMTPSGGRMDESEQTDALTNGQIAAIPTGVPIFKEVTEWATGVKREREVLIVDSSYLSPTSMWQRVRAFKSGSVLGDALFIVIAGLGFIFFLIALAAIVSAVFLTRSITGAVHYLYEGTRKVEAGDFEHEINITGSDQLAALSGSFNQMTRSIRELLHVSAEKQRLDQEMKIAAQVQSRLFPRSTPKTTKLDFAAGICIPARAVSGDYYDFLEVAPGIIGIVVADVCGKGVSAALMMANLQANLRGQVQAYHDAYNFKMTLAAQSEAFEAMGGNQNRSHRPDESHAHPVKRIVQRVNQRVAASVIDASYITFFYAEFDERHSRLRYTNAGHNPPLLFRANNAGDDKIVRLDRGGTVLGLFDDIEYEDVELTIESGDVLIAFTDGLIEAHNPQGEEFGEQRVIDLVAQNSHLCAAEIEREILTAVREWTRDSEQEDDLTLVIFKVT
ncbi:MAG: PP2C family protein-serine/threonine phosphatase [Blastocatellales bacterium]